MSDWEIHFRPEAEVKLNLQMDAVREARSLRDGRDGFVIYGGRG